MKPMICLLLLTAGLVFAQPTSQPAGTPRTRVLVITGRDVAAHNWRETTPVLREHLEKSDKFEVVVSEEPLGACPSNGSYCRGWLCCDRKTQDPTSTTYPSRRFSCITRTDS